MTDYNKVVKRVITKDVNKNIIERLEYNINNDPIFTFGKDNIKRQYKYDDNGNCIFYESFDSSSSRYYERKEYDSNNNLIFLDNNGLKTWYKYDENGNCIYSKEEDEYGQVYIDEKVYNKDGLIISSRDNEGNSDIYVYNNKNHLTAYITSGGYEETYSYNKNGLLTKRTSKYSDGSLASRIIKYNDNNNIIYEKDIYNYKQWFEYDNKGNCIHYKNNKGTKVWREFDEYNNCIHYTDLSNTELIYKNEYNENGTIIYQEISHINKKYPEYNTTSIKRFDLNGNETYSKSIDGVELFTDIFID